MVTIEPFQEVCAPYWPQSGVFSYGDMTVTSVSAVEAKEFTTRVFKVMDKVRITCTVTSSYSQFSQPVLLKV